MQCPPEILGHLLNMCQMPEKAVDSFLQGTPYYDVVLFLQDRGDDVIVCSHDWVGVTVLSKGALDDMYYLRYVERIRNEDEWSSGRSFEVWKDEVEGRRAEVLNIINLLQASFGEAPLIELPQFTDINDLEDWEEDDWDESEEEGSLITFEDWLTQNELTFNEDSQHIEEDLGIYLEEIEPSSHLKLV